jgi:putative membrane protein
MTQFHSSGFMFGWVWILWFGFIFLMFSSLGNWNYAYRAHRKVDGSSIKDAATILKERYAAGALTRTQYLEMKSDIAAT